MNGVPTVQEIVLLCAFEIFLFVRKIDICRQMCAITSIDTMNKGCAVQNGTCAWTITVTFGVREAICAVGV